MCLSGARERAQETGITVLSVVDRDMCPKRDIKIGLVPVARLIAFLLRRPHAMGRPFKAVTTSLARRVSGFFSPVAGILSVCVSRAGIFLHCAAAAKLNGGSHLVPHTMG